MAEEKLRPEQIRSERNRLESGIRSLEEHLSQRKDQLKKLQEYCPHPSVEKKAGHGFMPCIENRCYNCGKFWATPQPLNKPSHS